MNTTAQSLNEELGTDLLSQLSMEDQHEVDKLNDQITALTNENKKSLKERIKVSDKIVRKFENWQDNGTMCAS